MGPDCVKVEDRFPNLTKGAEVAVVMACIDDMGVENGVATLIGDTVDEALAQSKPML